MNSGELFTSGDLLHEIKSRKRRISDAVNSIPKEQFLVATEKELVDFVVHSLSFDPLVLHTENKTMSLSETTVEVLDDFRFRPRPSVQVPGIQTEIHIPFSGDENLFKYAASIVTNMPPRGRVNNGKVILTYSHPQGTAPEKIQSEINQEIDRIKQYVSYTNSDVFEFNSSLQSSVYSRIQSRQELLRNLGNTAALIGIPISENPDAPSIAPIELNPRIKPLPLPPKNGLESEPGIYEHDFEVILNYIRHQCRTFERAPHNCAVHDEEGLRDFILAQLNSHFEGKATSETFRTSGKTDICIESDNRMAFVGECKCWTGQAGVGSAIDQLLGYMTWRDCKAALIIFNKRNKKFQAILDQIPGILSTHRLYDAELTEHSDPSSGEWRVVMRSVNDPGRRIHVHVFVFNIYHKRPVRSSRSGGKSAGRS